MKIITCASSQFKISFMLTWQIDANRKWNDTLSCLSICDIAFSGTNKCCQNIVRVAKKSRGKELPVLLFQKKKERSNASSNISKFAFSSLLTRGFSDFLIPFFQKRFECVTKQFWSENGQIPMYQNWNIWTWNDLIEEYNAFNMLDVTFCFKPK